VVLLIEAATYGFAVTTTLWRGGRVRSPADPFATALLVDGGTVAWVGSDQAAAALTADRVIDLEDAWLAPAFVDAHVHLTATGLALTGLDLTDAPSLAVALDQVAAATRLARGGVVLGTGWDETRWPEGRPPTAHELDRASYGSVVYLARTDVHSAVASSALLAAAPQARALTGFLGDGLVRQDAHHEVRRAAYAAITPAQRRAAQTATLDRAAALGIACVHECGGPDIAGEEDFTAALALEHGVQVLGYWGELDGVDRARELGALGAGGDLFVDGALGSHTAALREPYADDPGAGTCYLGAEEVARHVAACTRAGLQSGFHAIGDAALDAVLAGVAQAAQEVGLPALRALRHRVEHAELLRPEHIAGLAAHGLVASVQPAFDARWGGPQGMYAARLGAARAGTMNPFAALATAGVALALGSDAPVTPLDPWGTLRAAVGHRTRGSGLSARAAFAAHTRGGWRAAGVDGAGELVPGAPATFAVWEVDGELVVQAPDERVAGWSTDPRSGIAGLPDLTGPDPRCRATIVAGMIVHEGT
jgi:predicted amidohydrolase YtcJ